MSWCALSRHVTEVYWESKNALLTTGSGDQSYIDWSAACWDSNSWDSLVATLKCAGQRWSRAGWYRDVCTERSISPCCVSLAARPLAKTLPTPWCCLLHHCHGLTAAAACRVYQSSINVRTTYALCVLVSYVYLKLLTAVNFKNERKKKKKYALNIRGIV